MKDEQVKTLEGLRLAIQMEIDGKEYYQKASHESDNRAGKELFEWLAAEEDKHRQRFEKIYETINNQQSWPETEINPEKGKGLDTLFSQAMNMAVPGSKASFAELDIIARAMDMEDRTRDFYEAQGINAVYDAERRFYEALAVEERSHYLVLVDYREYLIDPEGWFRKVEHHSMDGG